MDKYELSRFIEAQDKCYLNVVAELKKGKKRTHWMWYIFPQIIGLGSSDYAKYYAFKSIDEARDYLRNETLKNRLFELIQILLDLEINDPKYIFEYPDYLKFHSSLTLFNYIEPKEELFNKALDKFYAGKKDDLTLKIIKKME